MQAPLGLPAARDHVGGLTSLAALKLAAAAGCAPVVPGRLDQQAARVLAAGLRDRALPALAARAVLAGNQAEVTHQRLRSLETSEVTDLGRQPERRKRVDSAQ